MIVLVGFMGAGKSTVGRLLAERLALPFTDVDDVIESRHGAISAIFQRSGEPAFRALEADVIDECLRGPFGVLSLGAGAVETPRVRTMLDGHEVWWLDVNLRGTRRRVGDDPARPMLAAPGLRERFDSRRALYAEVATHRLDVNRGTAKSVLARLLAMRERQTPVACVTIGDVVLGDGVPKIIVPLVGSTAAEILDEGAAAASLDCDLVEWRIDYYADVADAVKTAELSRTLKAAVGKPVLVTFRTKREGGQRELPEAAYFAVYDAVIAHGCADLVDVELALPAERVARLVSAAHAQGIKVVMSSHDFESTPPKDEIIRRLRSMQDRGADVLKIAVMPRTPDDVLTLLRATEEMHRLYARRPLITMAMGPLGAVSRVSGELFGSCATFGAAAQSSAPGQIPVDELRAILNALKPE